MATAVAWDMRISSSLVMVLLVGTTSLAQAEQKPMVQKALTASAGKVRPDAVHTLGLGDANEGVKPVSADIERCYLDNAADVKGAGHLDVTLVVHRNGRVQQVEVKTPGLAKARSEKINACVKGLVADLKFPERKAFTTVVVPYFFQHTAAPDSGPQYSCWDPNGCKTR
jgi:hypothetical protein